MAHLTAYHYYLEKLVKCLPMDDTHFITTLSAQELLPGNTKSKIKTMFTQADKASYFLDHVIKPALEIDDISAFDKLLSIMQGCGYKHVQKLAVAIKCKLDKPDKRKSHTSGKTPCNICNSYIYLYYNTRRPFCFDFCYNSNVPIATAYILQISYPNIKRH